MSSRENIPVDVAPQQSTSFRPTKVSDKASSPRPPLSSVVSEENNDTSPESAGPSGLDLELFVELEGARQQRDNLIRHRLTARNQNKDYVLIREETKKTFAAFMKAAEKFLASRSAKWFDDKDFQQVQSAFSTVESFSLRLEELEKKYKQTSADLELRETELENREKKIYKRVKRTTDSLPGRHYRMISRSRRRIATSAPSVSSASTDPLARKYHKRVGDVKNLRERLHNLQVQNIQDVALRQSRKEQGQTVLPTEQAFWATYYERLTSNLADLDAAKRDARRWRSSCHENGVQVEEDPGAAFDKDEALHLGLDLDRKIIEHFATQETSRTRFALLSHTLSGYMDTTSKVRNWLKTLLPSDGNGDIRPRLSEDNEPAANTNLLDIRDKIQPFQSHGSSLPEDPVDPADAANVNSTDPDYYDQNQAESDDFRDHNNARQPNSQTWTDRGPERKFLGYAPERRYSDPLPLQLEIRSDVTNEVQLIPGRPNSWILS